MGKMTISTPVTLHVQGDRHEPVRFDKDGLRVGGVYHAEEVPPGTAVTLDEAEAKAILKRFGGQVIDAAGKKTEVDPAPPQIPKVTGDVGKPGGPKA